MAKNNKINMPMSGAGITRYFEDYKSSIEFKPGHIVVLAVIVIIFVLVLNFFGKQIFGVSF